jgi:hypothetical protein
VEKVYIISNKLRDQFPLKKKQNVLMRLALIIPESPTQMYFLDGYALIICVIISILYVSGGLRNFKLHVNFLRFIVPVGYLYFSKKQRRAGNLNIYFRFFYRLNN